MELIFTSILILFLVGMFIVSQSFEMKTVDGDVLSSSGFPEIMSVVGILLAVFIIIRLIRKKKSPEERPIASRAQPGRAVLLNVVLLTAYIALMNVIGFVISTLAYSFGAARAMGYKKIHLTIVFSLVVTIWFVVIFGMVFYVPLPRGIGLVRELSYFLY